MTITSSKTVLCVDDDEEICDLLKEYMELAGYRALVCYSGNDAIELLTHERVDMVLTDMRMPNGDGLSLLNHIRSTHPQMPVVFMVTGFNQMSEDAISKAGAQGLFHKPIDVERLIQAIHSHLKD